MNKFLLISIAIGGLFAGLALAAEVVPPAYFPPVCECEPYDPGSGALPPGHRKCRPCESSPKLSAEDQAEADKKSDEIWAGYLARKQRIEMQDRYKMINDSINTPKPSSVVPLFVPRPQYTGPVITPGSPTSVTPLMYEIMRQRALRDQGGVAPDPIYYRPISPSVPCGPGCMPSAPPSFLERMRQNAKELQWKLFPSTRPVCPAC